MNDLLLHPQQRLINMLSMVLRALKIRVLISACCCANYREVIFVQWGVPLGFKFDLTG